MIQIDFAVADLVWLIVGIVETYASQRCRTRDGYLISQKEMLHYRERSSSVDRIHSAGRCPGDAQYEGVYCPSDGIPADARQFLGPEYNSVCFAIQTVAFGRDRHPIGAVGGEARQKNFRSGGDDGGERRVFDIAVVDGEACGSTEFGIEIPREAGCGGCG